jgi:hypothetical protein
MKTAIDRCNIQDRALNGDLWLENCAAQLTRAVYPIALARGLKRSWIDLELDLWRALAKTVNKWSRERPYPAPSSAFKTWREGLLAELTESAFYVAVKNGIEGPLLEVELDLYRAFSLMFGRRIWEREQSLD